MAALIQVAQVFASVVSAIFGKFVKTNKDVTKTTKQASTGISNMGDAAEKAGKQAEEALLPFDDLNVLQQNTGTSGNSGGGSGADTGIDLGELNDFELDTGIFDQFSEQIERIKKILGTLWEPFKLAWENQGQNVINAAKRLFSELGLLTESVGKSILSVFENGTIQAILENIYAIIANVVNIFANLIEAYRKAWDENERGTMLVQQMSDTFNSLTSAVKSLFDRLVEFTSNPMVQKYFENAIKMVTSFWQILEGLLEFLDGIFSGDYEKIWNGLKDFTSGVLGLIYYAVMDKFLMIGAIIQNSLNTIGLFFTNTWNSIFDFAKEILVKFLNKIDEVFPGSKDIIITAMTSIKNKINEILNCIKKKWNDTWDSLKNKISEIFSSIYNVIKKPINSVINAVEIMVNRVITGLNAMIRALNKLKFTIPDWVPAVGGKSFGINISQIGNISIPRLATGAVIPPNAEFAAILGDQKNGRNLEAPEGLIRQIVREETEALAKRPIYVRADISGKTLMNIIAEQEDDKNRANGYSTGGGILAY